jgi:hypothetical protein
MFPPREFGIASSLQPKAKSAHHFVVDPSMRKLDAEIFETDVRDVIGEASVVKRRRASGLGTSGKYHLFGICNEVATTEQCLLACC